MPEYFAAQPPALDWLEEAFPFPLALTYRRLRYTFDRQQPIEASWAVRDAWEVAIKFCACLSVADFLQAEPEPTKAGEVATALLSSRGVAIGTWRHVLHLTLDDPLRTWGENPATGTTRRCPELWPVFRTAKGFKTTTSWKMVESFIGWRNGVFGHGVFNHDLPWYAQQTQEWLAKLVAFYETLKHVFGGWQLVGHTAGGETVDWSGCDFQPKHQQHDHDPVGHALAMSFVREGVELKFGPLLSVQRCAACDHPAAFFFDGQKKEDETTLLEYFAGAKRTRKNWSEIAELQKRLPTEFKWERKVYDTSVVLEGFPIVFRDFDTEYLRPAYLLEQIRQQIDSTASGYLLVDGPEGTGKSYLARGLAEKETGLEAPVVAYYVRAGRETDYQYFAIELRKQLEAKFHGRSTMDLQLKTASAAEMQKEFVDFFTKYLAGTSGLILVIDGLDELPDGDPTTPLITDLLPDASKLPPRMHIVLTARAAELKPRVQARWQALAPHATMIALDPASTANRDLVRAYLAQQKDYANMAEAILARSGAVFFYAWHYVAALRQGVFTTAAELPDADEFYPVFLDRLRQRVGPTLYKEVYRPLLLLLVAARVPVTREELERWGLRSDQLAAALAEFRDFVRQLRHRDWHDGLAAVAEPRYTIAHEAFVRYAEQMEAPALQAAHTTIAQAALRHQETRWEGIDPANDADLYDLRFVLHHCDTAGLTQEAAALRGDDVLARATFRVANQLGKFAKHKLNSSARQRQQ